MAELVEGVGLENRRPFTGSVGSNPTLSAKKIEPDGFYFVLYIHPYFLD